MIKLFEEFIKKSDNLTELIIKVRDKFIKRKKCSISDINKGKCVDFVDEILDMFDGSFDTLTTSQFVISDEKQKEYLISQYHDVMLNYDGVEWSKNMLDEYGYPDKDLMNQEPPSHIWIYYQGKHYDAESPDGVDNPWSLPIFDDEDNWF